MTAPTVDLPAPPPPPAPPAEPAPAAPRRAVLAALACGVAAAALIPGGPPGLGVPLLALAVVAALLPLGLLRGADRWQTACLLSAVALTSVAAVRDAQWLVALDLLAAAGVASLALVPWRSWSGVLRGLMVVAAASPGAGAWLAHGLRRDVARTRWAAAAPALRGAALAALLLAVFVPLLVSADAAFARLLGALVPDLTLGPTTAGRAVLLVAGAVAGAAAARVLLRRPAEPQLPPPTRLLRGTSEWLLPLGSLVALLGAFVALQAQVLFAGREHVLSSSGLTYAEHTRSGFWQLLAVTALVLAVVAAAARWTPRGRGVRALLASLCLLALVIDASSLSRLALYVEEYGLTRLRVLVAATCVWLAVVLLAVLAAGVHRHGGRWLPRTVVLAAVAVLLALSAANPDARIARAAVERGERADTTYLSTLSADAVPTLLELPAPSRGCVLDGTARRLAQEEPWTSWNRSRARASELLSAAPPLRCGP